MDTTELIYENPKFFNEQEVDSVILNGNVDNICKMLAGVSLYSEKFEFIEKTIARWITSEHISIVSMCITALNHLARRYIDSFNKEKWLDIINSSQYKNKLANQIEELISDIEFYSRDTIETEILNEMIPSKNITLQVIEYKEDDEVSFLGYTIDETGKKAFCGEYQDLNELIDDIKTEFDVNVNLI